VEKHIFLGVRRDGWCRKVVGFIWDFELQWSIYEVRWWRRFSLGLRLLLGGRVLLPLRRRARIWTLLHV
jgi:hypothetical protein